MVKRPDMYLNAGFALAGLMAGGAALFILPVVAVAFVVGMKNTLQNRPEHTMHPKLITASAAGLFTGIGHSSGHGLIAAAHALNTVVLVEMERRITPGGGKQIIKDVLGGIRKILSFQSPFKKDEAPKVEEQPKVTVVQPTGTAPATGTVTVSSERVPGPELSASELDKVDLQEAFKARAKIQLPANENAPAPEQKAQPAEQHGTRPAPKSPTAP